MAVRVGSYIFPNMEEAEPCLTGHQKARSPMEARLNNVADAERWGVWPKVLERVIPVFGRRGCRGLKKNEPVAAIGGGECGEYR